MKSKRQILRYVTLIFPVILFLNLFSAEVFAQLRLAKIFSDHSVLQRQKPIHIWGWARPSEKISVSLGGQTKTALAGPNGRWMVALSPMEAGGPFELKVSGDTEALSVRDVLIGEVWFCSGQSNMEWTVKQADNFAEEKNNADFPQIRHFFVPHRVELSPQDDLEVGEWRSSSADTVGDFTAIGFFFAREIYQKLNIPIGLVHSSWGGSQVEGWISREGMLSSDELRDYGQNFPKTWAEGDLLLEQNIKRTVLGSKDANPTLADEQRYLDPDYDISGWIARNPMGQWDWKGIWQFRGNGFMARNVDLPGDEFVNGETTLGLAESYGLTEIYINGQRVFTGILKGKREIVIPRNTWKSGKNRIVVKMNRVIEPDWFGLGLQGSANDVFVASKTIKIPLGTDNWYLMPSFAEKHEYAHSSNNIGTIIFNGMIAPIVPFTIRGVLWYQGETNAGRSYQYRKTFPLLIEDWRKKWGDEFYFFFVQLSSFGSNQSSNQGSGWAELREAQTMALSLPKTGMAVTTDIGSPSDIHPTNKQDVGRRLASNALKLAYGKDVPFSGPVFDLVKFENGRAIITFKYVYDGLSVKDKFGYLKGFEIAGPDRVFYYAKAEIVNDQVVVHNPQVKNPAAVRYGWSDAPIDANLFNSAGFPAGPFRTDSWPGITVNNKFQ